MFLPRFVRKLLGVLRGNVAPPLIFLSVLLGVWMGLMPGWSGLHTALTVLVLVVNIHVGLFILSLGFGKAVSLAAAAVLYHAGLWAHEHLAALLSTLSSVPVVGITDFDRLALAGGLILGPIVGAVCGLVLAVVVFSFRRTMLKINEKSERFRTYYSKFWVRVLDWFLFGKRTKDVHAMFAKAKYIRKAGVVLAILLVGGSLAAAHFLQGTVVQNYTAQALTKANKAEANVNTLGISVLGGSVEVSGVQLTDPKNPMQNQLAIEKMEANADLYQLSVGKLVIEKAELTQVRFNQLRQTPGKVLEQVVEEKPFDPNAYKVSREDLAKLEKYIKDAKKLKEQLEKLRNWLPKGKPADSNQPTTAQKPPENYSEYLTARLQTPATPRMLAKLLLADKTEIPSKLFGNSKVEVENLNDAPGAADLPIKLRLKSYDTSALLEAVADYSQGDVPVISGTFEGFDLSKLQELSPDAGLKLQSGQASGTFTGTMTKENMDLTIRMSVKDLQAQGTGQGVLGLGAEPTSQALQMLKSLNMTVRVVGSPTDPRLVFDTKGLTKEFQQAIAKGVKDRAIQEIDKQVEKQLGGKLGEKLPTQLKDAIKKPDTKGLVDGLGGLLGGKKKQEPPPQKK
ncbi:MAG: hypothetical protein MUC88_23040 [Planctomycetes bacterium]|jgi:uncharacterized protein (TIGR03546 family)|nr:hypothetical protein [Planctomycetota bacterium]